MTNLPAPAAKPIVRVLHEERVKRKLSIKDLARITGWTDVSIGNMERGKSVSLRVVTDCAQALDVVIMALPGDAWGKDNANG